MSREQGIAEWTSRGGRVTTLATTTCCHCNAVTIIEQGAKPDDCGGFCRLCMAPTCRNCAGKSCTPFERRLEEYEARGRLLRSMGF